MIKLGRQLVANIFSSWGSYVGRVLIAFFFIPYITSSLGESTYGVWVILFQLANYLSFLDFGLERALTRFISRFVAAEDYDRVNRLIALTSRAYLLLGLMALVGSVVISLFVVDRFEIGSEILVADARQAVVVIGLFVALRFWLLPIAGNLHSFQRADVANLLGFIEELLRAGLLVLLLHRGTTLTGLATAIVGLSFLRQIFAAIWLRAKFPKLRFSLKGTEPGIKGELFRYSTYAFGISLTGLVLYGSDSVLLGLMLSSAAAGIYAPGAQLLLYLRQLLNAAATVITPAVARLEQREDWDSIRQLYLMSVKYSTILSITAGVGLWLLARPFVRLWLEPGFHQAGEVMIALAAGSVFFMPQIIGNSILYAIEKHRYLFYFTLIEAVLKLGLGIILIDSHGLVGLAWATTIVQLLFYILPYPILMANCLKLKTRQIWGSMLFSLLLAGGVVGAIGWLTSQWAPVEDWSGLILSAVIISLAGIGCVRLAVNDTERRLYQTLNESSS